MPRTLTAIALLIGLMLVPGSATRAQTPAGPAALSALPASLQAHSLLFAQQPPMPSTSEVVDRIKDEGLNRSQVMQTLSYLSDVIGPRLTASPNMKRANEWTRDRLASWGLQSAHLEAWGPFGRGWSLQRFSAQVVAPQCIPLIAFPKAWSPGTNGPVTADVVYVEAKTEADLEKYRGKLKGVVVLSGTVRDVKAHFDPEGRRQTDSELLAMANATGAGGGRRGGPPRLQPGQTPQTPEQRAQFEQFRAQNALAGRKAQLFAEEGVAMVLEPSTRGDGGTLFVQSASVTPAPGAANAQPVPAQRRGGPWDKDAKVLPQAAVAVEHFNRLVRMLQAGEKVKMTVDLAVQFHDQDPMGYNTVAEIPGSDPTLKEELVMVGGHMDSWHSGTGATDNGAGCAVGMEAVRILQALKLQPRRTIRIALWSGEEQGLLGSRAYVAEHFGRLEGGPGPGGAGGAAAGGQRPVGKLTTKPEYDRFNVYFNLDNGTGKIRGVYLQGNDGVRPIFRQWLAPFRDMGASTLTTSNTGGTDHQSFDGIGLPGFQFIQDEVEYDARTHHSNMDVFDRIQADDLKQASVVMASFLYNAATMDQKLPRKPPPGTR